MDRVRPTRENFKTGEPASTQFYKRLKVRNQFIIRESSVQVSESNVHC